MKDSGKSIEEVSQLSAREIAQIRKRYALHRKYEEALNLYANTNSTVRDIAKQTILERTDVTPSWYIHQRKRP